MCNHLNSTVTKLSQITRDLTKLTIKSSEEIPWH